MADDVYLSGRLVISASSGWLLLEVPQGLVAGMFSALREPGISMSPGRAHISVMSADEIARIGGPGKITERGQEVAYTLKGVREINRPQGWSEVSKCWVMECRSPALEKIRMSYGLEPKRKGFQFHITFAVRYRPGAVKQADATAVTDPARRVLTVGGLGWLGKNLVQAVNEAKGLGAKALTVGKTLGNVGINMAPWMLPWAVPAFRDDPNDPNISGDISKFLQKFTLSETALSGVNGGLMGRPVSKAMGARSLYLYPLMGLAGENLRLLKDRLNGTLGTPAWWLREMKEQNVFRNRGKRDALDKPNRWSQGWDLLWDPMKAVRVGTRAVMDRDGALTDLTDRFKNDDARSKLMALAYQSGLQGGNDAAEAAVQALLAEIQSRSGDAAYQDASEWAKRMFSEGLRMGGS